MAEQAAIELGAILFNEEVVAWETLEEYFLREKIVLPYVEGSSTLPARRMLRELLRMAAAQLPTVVSPKIAESLAKPSPKGVAFSDWDKDQVKKSANVKRSGEPGPKAAKKPKSMPTHRVAWDRPWKPRPGVTE